MRRDIRMIYKVTTILGCRIGERCIVFVPTKTLVEIGDDMKELQF